MNGQSPKEGSGRKAHHIMATWDLTVARQLVGCAARKAPPGLVARLEEEWLADLAARQGAFSRICFGLGCCWATRVIAREFGVAAAAAGSSASGQQVLVPYGGYDFSRVSRRTLALIVIVCLHAAAFYAYLSGLNQRTITLPAAPIDVLMPQRMRHRPVPPPKLTLPKVGALPTPLVRLDLPTVPTTITVPRLPQPNIASVQPPAVRPVSRVTGGPGAGFPNTGDYYPSDARRLEEAGNTVVSVCVDSRGRLAAAPTVVGSSGFKLIDQGALRLARAGSGHYRPTTENGQPVSSCYAFRITFQLEDQ